MTVNNVGSPTPRNGPAGFHREATRLVVRMSKQRRMIAEIEESGTRREKLWLPLLRWAHLVTKRKYARVVRPTSRTWP